MKQFLSVNLLIIFLIGIFALQLSSCSSPQTYLPVDASLIKQDMSQDEVKKIVGVPDAVSINDAGEEQWFYYNDISHFWNRIPWIGGGGKVETLMITFRDAKVRHWIYYVEEL